MCYLTTIPVMFLVPISLSASLLTDWALGSQAQGEWTGAGAGAESGARSRDPVGGMLLLGNRLIYFLMGPSREADMSQLELYVKLILHLLKAVKLLKIHLLHISVKLQGSKSCYFFVSKIVKGGIRFHLVCWKYLSASGHWSICIMCYEGRSQLLSSQQTSPISGNCYCFIIVGNWFSQFSEIGVNKSTTIQNIQRNSTQCWDDWKMSDHNEV